MFQKNFYQHEKECKQRIGVVFGGIDFLSAEETLCYYGCYSKVLHELGSSPVSKKYIKRFALDENKKI